MDFSIFLPWSCCAYTKEKFSAKCCRLATGLSKYKWRRRMAFNNRIFLAHASEDEERVKDLYRRLQEHGLHPWLDKIDLVPGQNWQIEIPKAIQSAAIFLACLSKNSVAKRGYVQQEFRYALSAYAKFPPGSIYLIPVRLDDCDVPDLQSPELGLDLRHLQWVDLFEEDDIKQLVKAIEIGAVLGGATIVSIAIFASPIEQWLFGKSDNNDQGQVPFRQPDELPQNESESAVPENQSTGQRLSEREGEVFRDCTFCPEMVVLAAGKYMRGSPTYEAGRYENREGPQHEVTIERPFAIGKYEISFQEYDKFAGATKRDFPEDNEWGRGLRPVINVNWNDARAYCSWLASETGYGYRLPSDAEWEYAARAGTDTRYAFGDEITAKQANFLNSLGRTSKIGQYPANSWGLHDMHGNVAEWVMDSYLRYSSRGTPKDSSAHISSSGSYKTYRGGDWQSDERDVRSAFRDTTFARMTQSSPDLPSIVALDFGFKCARDIENDQSEYSDLKKENDATETNTQISKINTEQVYRDDKYDEVIGTWLGAVNQRGAGPYSVVVELLEGGQGTIEYLILRESPP